MACLATNDNRSLIGQFPPERIIRGYRNIHILEESPTVWEKRDQLVAHAAWTAENVYGPEPEQLFFCGDWQTRSGLFRRNANLMPRGEHLPSFLEDLFVHIRRRLDVHSE